MAAKYNLIPAFVNSILRKHLRPKAKDLLGALTANLEPQTLRRTTQEHLELPVFNKPKPSAYFMTYLTFLKFR